MSERPSPPEAPRTELAASQARAALDADEVPEEAGEP